MRDSVVVVRTTLRVHDNALLAFDGPVLYVIDEMRLPRDHLESSHVNSCCWSEHQFAFLVYALTRHAEDLGRIGRKLVVIRTGDLDATMGWIGKEFRTVVMDSTYDPAYRTFDRLATEKCENVRFVNTATLVDWAKHDALEFANAYWKKCYKRSGKIKQFIVKHRRSYEKVRLGPDGGAGVEVDAADLLQRSVTPSFFHIVDLQKMAKSYPSAYPFHTVAPDGTSFDRRVRKFARRSLVRLSDSTWSKPATARNLGLLEYGASPEDDSSKLSPYLALGILSPLFALKTVWTSRKEVPRPGSIADQLLFRESWYSVAASIHSEGFWRNTPGWWDPNSKYRAEPPPPDATWMSSEQAWNWANASMPETWVDANESMRLLRSTGWIHHLRRHLVADVLCRGKMQLHFLYGEAWFRATEIDHDAVLNRANWLWLSANAFSTKQFVRHYSPDTYIQKRSAPPTCSIADRDCTRRVRSVP